MKVVIQRVSSASVSVDNNIEGSIGAGFLILLGVGTDDDQSDLDWLIKTIVALRVFSDAEGKMNLSINDVGGECLVISQFTLHASTKKGNRPSFIKAARPDTAIPIYEDFIRALRFHGLSKVESGIFGADMQVSLVNDGPVTIIMDSKNRE